MHECCIRVCLGTAVLIFRHIFPSWRSISYGKLTLKTPADAGYGSYDNYMYCRENGIELFMKYPGYYEESKKTNDKNRFRASHFERTEDGGYICPAGHEFEVDKVTTDTRGVYARNNIKLL